MEIRYQVGFGNHFSTEAVTGALPINQNSPQKTDQGLYPEQISGSAFTAPRTQNLFTWTYRLYPSVKQGRLQPEEKLSRETFLPPQHLDPNQMRWNPMPTPKSPTTFIEGVRTICGTNAAGAGHGIQVHLYAFNKNVSHEYFMNADGDFLFVPEQGKLILYTELGVLAVEPQEIAVIPRGIKFKIESVGGNFARGYIGENFGLPFRLPELGPIGANGLAHRRHFLTPEACFEDINQSTKLWCKFGGKLWSAEMKHSPLDVVAWHGNYVPYKYDLRLFNTINTVSYDHPDPSIFTVLTSPTDTAGVANVDFVIFPPRWMVAENTFRPPYFHRNIMSEYMGLITGEYDAKTGGGFVPGGGSLHNFFSAHGPDVQTFERASSVELKPTKIDSTMAFMFETCRPYYLTDFAAKLRQNDYQDCWQGFQKHFKSQT